LGYNLVVKVKFIVNLFQRSYELAKENVPALSWDDYVKISGEQYASLLDTKPDDESVFQDFFEKNPAYIPGAADIDDRSGHTPYPLALISQPPLKGSFSRVPDFLWLAAYSGVFCPVFIEIEAPAKRLFNKDDSYTADFNQARRQIDEWQAWHESTGHKDVFMRTIHADTSYLSRDRFLPRYVLICGRRSEFMGSQPRSAVRAQLQLERSQIRSYDGLSPSYKASNCFTVRCTATGFEAIEIMPTLKIWSANAETYSLISNKEEAIQKNQLMSPDRKNFLIERFKYWDNWIKVTPRENRGGYGPDIE
jgi:hypothetical protein